MTIMMLIMTIMAMTMTIVIIMTKIMKMIMIALTQDSLNMHMLNAAAVEKT